MLTFPSERTAVDAELMIERQQVLRLINQLLEARTEPEVQQILQREGLGEKRR